MQLPIPKIIPFGTLSSYMVDAGTLLPEGGLKIKNVGKCAVAAP